MDLFQRDGELWRRSFEEHAEYAYEVRELRDWLAAAGFSEIHVFGDRVMREPASEEQRIYFAAVKECV